MTSPSILSRPVPRSERRAKLLAASALCGVAAMLAAPALAQTLPAIPGAGSITVSSGGSQPIITAPDINTLDIELNAPRTVINWSDLHVSAPDAMIFHFDANSDVVLNKTTSQIAIDAGGTVAGLVGGSTGGNIWFYSPQGVIVSPGANMSAGGFLFSRGSSLSDVGFVSAADPLADLRAATDALIKVTSFSTATSASINSSGDVVLSRSGGGNLVADIVEGTTATMSTTSNSITVGEITATTGAAQVLSGGAGATVTKITGVTGVTVGSNVNSSVGSATTTGAGDILISAVNGSASLTQGNSSRDLTLSANLIFVSTVDAARDIFVTSTSQATITNRMFAGDDIEITAPGSITAGGAYLKSTGVGAIDDAHILVRSIGDSVSVNIGQTQGTGVAAGDVTISAANSATINSASSSRDLTVSGASASLTSGTAARDIFVTATAGDAAVVTSASAGDDVEVTATSGDVAAGGATLTSTGVGASDDGHVLARSTSAGVTVGAARTQGTGAVAGDVTISAGGAATLTTGDSSRDLEVLGATADLGTGDAARDLFVTASLGDASVTTQAFAGRAVEVTSAVGDVLAAGATLKSTGLGAGAGAHVLAKSLLGSVTVGAVTTEGTGVAAGDVTIDALTTVTATSAQSSRDVIVTGAGNVDLASATAEGDITVSSLGGDAILGKAVLTGSGAGHDLSVTADGVAILGSLDYLGITAVNTFSRTGGNTGTVTVSSQTAGAGVHLDTSALIDTVEGQSVDVTINSGPAAFGAITAHGNDIYVEALDGALTVGTATADAGDLKLAAYDGDLTVGTATANSGDLELYAYGADLTLTDSAHGGGLVHLEAGGLLDGTTASLISSDGDLELFGGDVDVGRITADGAISAAALTGNALVRLAQAGQTVQVLSLAGDATLRGGEGPDGIAVVALNKAVFGADDKASITTANYAVTDGGCGCGSGGLQVLSSDGNAVVNIDSATNGIALVAAAIDGDVTVVQKTGDLKIDELAGYNITLEAMAGTLETGATTSSGGDYTVTAQDFLGDVLTPTLFTGEIHDVTITDTLGDLNLGASVIHAGRKLTITALDGAVTGSAQLDAGTGAHDGQVTVTADAIDLDAVQSDGDVSLTATTGGVNLGAAGVHADRLLHVTALNGAVTSPGQLDAGLGAGTHDGVVNVAANAITLGAVQSDGDVGLSAGTGGVNLGSVVHADRLLGIIALNGAVTGAGQLDAGSGTTFGDVEVAADAIALDTVRANRDVNLNAGTGLVNVATSLGVDRTYALIGGDFSAAALAPLGAKAGTWTILDQAGDFDFSGKTLRYGSSIAVNVFNGDVIGGDITSDTGTVFVQADGGSLGALYGGGGQVTAIGDVGGMAVGSAQGVGRITVTAVNGTASLGSAILTGPGIHGLTVRATNGEVVLGAATPGAITSGNVVTSTGSSIALAVTAPAGKVDINLDHTTNANLTTVSALNDVKIKVVNGSQRLGAITSTAGAVTINGPTGALTVDQLTAHSTSRITGIGDTRLIAADADAQLTVQSLAGALRLGDGTSGRVIDVAGGLTLQAFTDIVQEQGVLRANTLNVIARSGATLLGDNLIPNLNMVTVSAGDFAYHGVGNFILQDVVNVRAGTVDLRSDGTIGQNLAGVILAQKLTGSSVGAANFRAANEVVELGDFTNTTGLFRFNNSRSLTISGTVLSTGILSIASHGGMTIAGTGTVRANGAGDAVVLASDGVFTNARGADAVTAASAGGRWLIYTQAFGDPQGSTAGNTFNGLAGKSFYGAAYDFSASGFTAGVNNGNRFVYAYQPIITVTPDSRTVTYDGAIPSLSATVTGLVNGDLFTDAWLGALVISGATSKNAGTYTLNAVTGGLTSDLNYAFAAGPAGALRIDPKALSGVLSVASKTYDGTAAATGSIGLTGVVAGDTVGVSGTYAFADKNAELGKAVTASGVTLSGADAGNYILTPLVAAQADILKKGLTGALIANDKTYDGATAATGSIGLTGVVAGDAVSASGTYAFADKTAGAGKTVTASGVTLSGADGANYDLGALSTDTADILKKGLTGALTASDKTYDGTATATGSIGLTGVVSGDVVSAEGTYAFADKTAGAGKTVTASGVTLSGADGANYDLGPLSADTADILRKDLTGALAAGNKTYDGTTVATGSIGLTGVVSGDAVSASGTYAFADKSAATGKTVAASGVALSGADAANYILAPLGAGSADILKKSLTGALTAGNKTYDGTVAATGSIGLTGVVAGDAVSASGAYAFADRNAGAGKTVTALGAALTGLDAANYDLAGVSAGLADILRRPVTVAADSAFKPFGQVDPTLTYRVTVGDLAAGDAFTGRLARGAGEVPGDYGITRGTLDVSANYDLTFTGAVFTIRAIPSNEPDGSMALEHLNQSPDFTLDWNPEPNLMTEGQACSGEGCPPQAAVSGGGKVVAALR